MSTLAEPEHCTYEHCVGEYSHVLTPYPPPQLELPTSVVRSDGSRRTTEPYPVRICMQTIVNLADSQWTEAPVDCPRCLRAIQQANQAAAARRAERDR